MESRLELHGEVARPVVLDDLGRVVHREVLAFDVSGSQIAAYTPICERPLLLFGLGMLMNPLYNCLALRQATRRVTQLCDQALAPLGLRATQYSLLVEVERLGSISLIPLADAMVMDRATLGHNIRPLEADGYLVLSVGKDRRGREVSLTEEGRKVLTEAKPLWQRAQVIFEGEIRPNEAAALRAVLKRVAASEFAYA